MSDESSKRPDDHHRGEPALNPLGEPSKLAETHHDPDVIALGSEMAVAEGDIRWAEGREFVRGSSLATCNDRARAKRRIHRPERKTG